MQFLIFCWQGFQCLDVELRVKVHLGISLQASLVSTHSLLSKLFWRLPGRITNFSLMLFVVKQSSFVLQIHQIYHKVLSCGSQSKPTNYISTYLVFVYDDDHLLLISSALKSFFSILLFDGALNFVDKALDFVKNLESCCCCLAKGLNTRDQLRHLLLNILYVVPEENV